MTKKLVTLFSLIFLANLALNLPSNPEKNSIKFKELFRTKNFNKKISETRNRDKYQCILNIIPVEKSNCRFKEQRLICFQKGFHR